MIGGTDVVLWVSEKAPVADVILRTVRRYWPNFVVQNAEDDAPIPSRPGVWLPEPSGREFFIYQDENAAASWIEQGAMPENENRMLHIILGKRRRPELELRSLTLVCGELAGTMHALMNDIAAAFQDFTESLRPLQEAAA